MSRLPTFLFEKLFDSVFATRILSSCFLGGWSSLSHCCGGILAHFSSWHRLSSLSSLSSFLSICLFAAALQPQHFSWVKVWTLTWPFQNLDSFILQPFWHGFAGVLLKCFIFTNKPLGLFSTLPNKLSLLKSNNSTLVWFHLSIRRCSRSLVVRLDTVLNYCKPHLCFHVLFRQDDLSPGNPPKQIMFVW